MAIPSDPAKKPIDEIFNWQLDRTVDPYILQLGMMGKDTGGNWRALTISSSGALRSDDAANFRVSALGVNISDVSNSDAGDFRISAIIDSGSISAKSGDASQFRVSSILGSGSSNIGYVSAMIDNGSVSAKQSDGSNLRTSSFQTDAANLRVSAFTAAIDTTNSVDKVEQQMNYYYLSAAGIQTIKSSAGLLHTVTINTRGTGSTIKVYDNTTAASPLIANIDTTLTTTAFVYDAKFSTGLTVSTAGAAQADITVTYR